MIAVPYVICVALLICMYILNERWREYSKREVAALKKISMNFLDQMEREHTNDLNKLADFYYKETERLRKERDDANAYPRVSDNA